MNEPNVKEALVCLNVALDTIHGWALDENGRANIHPDIILKAIRAAIYNLAGDSHD